MTEKKYLLSLGLIISTIVSTYFVTVSTAQQSTAPVVVADNEHQVGAVLWMQKAAEFRALSYQAFNLARWQLDVDFEKKNLKRLPRVERKRPRAVVVDIDETVLDMKFIMPTKSKRTKMILNRLHHRTGGIRRNKKKIISRSSRIPSERNLYVEPVVTSLQARTENFRPGL